MAAETVKILPMSNKELDSLLNMAGPDNVTIPIETKTTILTTTPVVETDLDISKTNPTDDPITTESTASDPLDLSLGQGDQTQDDPTANTPVKVPFYNALEKLVKDEKFFLFEDEKDKDGKPVVRTIDQYSEKELTELFEANLDRVRAEEAEKVPGEFFDSLPLQLQYVAKYVADGGKDLKGIFKYLAQAEEVKNLDITTENGQEETIRQYLKLGGDHTPEEIEAEISSLKDITGALEKKAGSYKPKLESKQQQIIDKELRDQEALRTKQEQAAVKYRETVLKAIQPGEINGVKITPKTQQMLFNGLTMANYPSASGRNTNEFGHLIEKYTYVEPNPALIAEALWLLKDRKGYLEAAGAKLVEGVAAATFKTLKTAASEKTTNTAPGSDTTHTQNPVKKTLPKKTNIFART